MKHKVLAAVVFATGLVLSVVAAYFSITGLAALFPGDKEAVIILGSVAEAAKLALVSWLYHNRSYAHWSLRYPLVGMVLILMFITSLGVYGFLSRAHIEHELKLETGAKSELPMVELQIQPIESRISEIDKQLATISGAVDSLVAKGRAKEALSASDKQDKGSRSELVKEKASLVRELLPLQQKKITLETQVKTTEAEFGPIKYVAEVIFGRSDKDLLEWSVRAIIIILVITLDPLAILLLLAFNVSLARISDMNLEFVDIDRPKRRPPRPKPKEKK